MFIIAEIGINHNGDIELCKKLIDSAVTAGCNSVKFQKRDLDICIPEKQKKIIRETPWGLMTYLDYKKKLEFFYKQKLEDNSIKIYEVKRIFERCDIPLLIQKLIEDKALQMKLL